MKRVRASKERLHAGVKILNGDYETPIKEYDKGEAFTFLDPPYPGFNAGVREKEFDEVRFRKVLDAIKGKFLVTYGTKGKLDTSGFLVKQLSPRRYAGHARGELGDLVTLLISNYEPPAEMVKRLEEDYFVEDTEEIELSDEVAKGLGRIGARARAFVPGFLEHHGRVKRFAREPLLAAFDGGDVALKDLVGTLGQFPSEGEVSVDGTAPEVIESLRADCVAALQEPLPDMIGAPLARAARAFGELGAHDVAALDDGDPLPVFTPGAESAEKDPALVDAVKRVVSPEGVAPDPLLMLPKAERPSRAVVQCHLVGKSLHVDFRFSLGSHLVGWRVDTGRGDLDFDAVVAKRLASRLGPEGDRASRSFLSPHAAPAVAKGAHSTAWLDVDGEEFPAGSPGAGKAEKAFLFAVDRPKVEFGLQTDTLHEYFLSGSGPMAGRFLVKRASDRWTASLSRDLVPEVLRSVDAAMPPIGKSALPTHLREQVPEALRFWKFRGEDARRVRDALVKSNLFAADLVRMVEGEISRVVRKFYLPEAEVETRSFLDRIRDVLPEGRSLGESFGDLRAPELKKEIAFFDAAPELLAPDLAEKVTKALDEGFDFVVSARDCSEVRSALAPLGRVFKFFADEAVDAETIDRVIFASFPVFAKVDFCGEATSQASFEKVVKLLARETRLLKTAEERFVLGIVLEPEERDAQGDIYSEAEVQTAAHRFMEAFQNMGLMHRELVNGRVRILESYIERGEPEIDGFKVKRGTWMLATRIADDGLWNAVKTGKITGYSIGGSAVRVPDATS
jgi:hypothetical protein